jgi:glutamyl-tRNA synthetase
MTETAWEAIRPNLSHLAEAAEWWQVVTGPIAAPALDPEDRAYVAQAASLLRWSDDPWHSLTDALKAATGRKGRALFHPLRLALTGRDAGPDMKALLPLIGEAKARVRLERAGNA